MTDPSPSDLLECAIAAARAAGAHARTQEARRQATLQRTEHDVKLVLDHECQAVAQTVIHGAFPDHHFMGEEGGAAGDGSRPQWIVDPIDGTVNFTHGLPYWCSSVAVQMDGRTVAGAVYAPVLDRCYTASLACPASCNGRPIQVSSTADLAHALLLTGMERNFDQYPESTRVITAIVEKVQKIRLLGAAALDLCVVADGEADGFFESGLNLWDIAAGAFILERAGGHTEIIARLSNQRLRFMAANDHLFSPLRELMQAHPRWWVPTP